MTRYALAAILASALSGAGGCDGGANEQSPEQVLQQRSPRVALIRTTWFERRGGLGRWQGRGRLTCGVYLVSDGREALILAPRRDVDPAFGADAGTRDVVFEVSTPAQYAAGDSATARLVAVYINNQDLALLRAPSPSDQAFVTPVTKLESLAAGDAAALLAVPAGAALQTHRAEVIQPGAGGSADVLTPIALQLLSGAQPRPAVAFTLSGARLIGVVRGALDRPTDPPIVTATPAAGVLRPLHWAHLIEQGRTEMLLQRLQEGQ